MFILILIRGLLKFILLLAGLLVFVLAGVLFIDRGLPARVRELVASTSPKIMDWREEADQFAQGTRHNVEAITGDSGGLILRPGASNGEYDSNVHFFPGKWDALGVVWQAQPVPQTQTAIQVRFSLDGKKWSDWEDVENEEDLAAENVNYSRLIFAGSARYLQYRVSFSTDNPLALPKIQQIRFAAFDTSDDLKPTQTIQGADVNKIHIITREQWGANEALMTRAPEYVRPQKIMIHQASGIAQSSDPTAAVRALYYYHAVTRGLGDLAYNYLIDSQGNIYEGRAGGDNVVGEHARQYSYGAIGIALLGDYDQEPVSDEAKSALVDLIAYLAHRYSIAPQGTSNFYDLSNVPNVMMSQDMNCALACSGQFIANALPEIRTDASARLQALAPTIELYGTNPGKPVAGHKAIIAVSEALLTSRVEFYVDDKLEQTVQEPTSGNQFVWDWDTTSFAEGNHVVKITARGVNQNDATLQQNFVVDNSSPQAHIAINGGALYTRVPTITLELDVSDASAISLMQFVDPNGNPISGFEPFTSTKSVLLQPGDGVRMVAMRFADSIGNPSPVETAKIILDTEPPENWREFSGAANHASVLVSDKTSGVNLSSVKYSLSDDGTSWTDWQPAHAEWDGKSQTVRLLIPEYATKAYVRFYAADNADNVSESPAFPISAPTTMNVSALALPQDGNAIVTLKPTEPVTRTNGKPPAASTVNARPDLIVEAVQAQPNEIEANGKATFVITLRNSGPATPNGFWVALWIDPEHPPQLNSADPTRDNLVLWYVASLNANEALALTSANPYQPYTTFSGRLASGTHQLYVMVDAVNPNSVAGLVVEAGENNNVLGPISVRVNESTSAATDSLLEKIFGWWDQIKW